MARVYISGPMTGLPLLNKPAFTAAARELREAGYEVVNPAELDLGEGASWEAYMRHDIRALCDCDILALLPGWMDSKGAHLEVHIAHRIGLKLYTVAELVGP